jgi:predicted O-methyltransferase YrrM
LIVRNLLYNDGYNDIILLNIAGVIHNFQGIAYRLADNWYTCVDIEKYCNRPIQYLEIGTLFGANLLSIELTYGAHPESKLHCVDPWEDYDEYGEYKNIQPKIYETFLRNIENSGKKDKIIIHRGYSHNKVITFEDDFFDMIYIDGNHEPEYVLEDAVLSFRKLKKGGIMIFDDYGLGGLDLTKRGIDAFLSAYHKRIHFIGIKNNQLFVEKI